MKPLLRTFLAINAIIVLLLGLLFLITPWWHYFDPLSAFASSPAMIGQLLGVVLLGVGCLLVNAVGNGALTAPVARITGHPIWVSGVVLLIWQIALHEPVVSGQAAWVVLGFGVVLVVLGLGQARLGGAVRGREKREALGARSAERAEARARVDRMSAPGTGPVEWSRDRGAASGNASGASFAHGAADPYIGTPAGAVSRDPTDTPYVVRGPSDHDSGLIDPVAPEALPEPRKARGFRDFF